MKKIISIFAFVFALTAMANTAYATNSYATANGDGTYTGTLYASITAQADSWIELNKGTGMVQYGRATHPAGEFSATVTGLECNKSYPYRLGAINPYTGANYYGQTFNLQVTCGTTGGGTTNSVTVSTDSASPSQYAATVYGSTNTSADSWIEANLGNGTVQFGRGTHSGSYTAYLNSLQCNTTYYYRAVAQGSNGLVYGTTRSFTTAACNGNGGTTTNSVTVSTDSASPSQYAATVYGSTNTSADSWIEANLGNGTVQFGRGTHSGSYTAYLNSLQCNTTYYYRAVAQGSNGLVYGTTRSFTTAACNGNGGTTTNSNLTVITNNATGVSYSIARLNGIAITNGVTPTSGWFEYGTSSSLGNRTVTRTYYDTNSATLVDNLTGLSQGTTYYYRAVAQNSNGTSYGEIKSCRTDVFTSTGTNTNTNTTNTTTNTVRNTTTTAANTSGIVYIPVQLAQIGTIGINGATNVPTLATVSVTKSGAIGCENTFTVTYTNTSDRVLNNVLLNVELPNELGFVSATDGTYRETDGTLTLAIGTLASRESKTITVTTKVLDGAQVGKQVSVTSHLNYTDGDSTAQNQVTGYTLLTIGDNCTTTVIGTTQAGAAGLFGFLPSTLWQWLLVIFALALIIFAARSLFKGGSSAAH